MIITIGHRGGETDGGRRGRLGVVGVDVGRQRGCCGRGCGVGGRLRRLVSLGQQVGCSGEEFKFKSNALATTTMP